MSGRVTTNNGRGLQNATVTMTDANGHQRTTRTSSFGAYRFENVGAGQTYVFQVSSKRYTFAPQIFSVTDNLMNVDFTAQEPE